MGSLQINMLGTSFSIKATEDEDYLNKLLGYYSSIIDEIKSSGLLSNNLQVSILAGIMLCDELYKEKAAAAHGGNTASNGTADTETSIQAERRTLEMIKKLENALSNDNRINQGM